MGTNETVTTPRSIAYIAAWPAGRQLTYGVRLHHRGKVHFGWGWTTSNQRTEAQALALETVLDALDEADHREPLTLILRSEYLAAMLGFGVTRQKKRQYEISVKPSKSVEISWPELAVRAIDHNVALRMWDGPKEDGELRLVEKFLAEKRLGPEPIIGKPFRPELSLEED